MNLPHTPLCWLLRMSLLDAKSWASTRSILRSGLLVVREVPAVDLEKLLINYFSR